MLLSGMKKRWPLLTTAVAALLYLVNNYNIRGLDGVRLEPRAGAPVQDLSFGSAPFGFPTSLPSSPALQGPALPGTTPASYDAASFPGQLPNTSPFGNQNQAYGNQAYGNQAYNAQGYSAGYPGSQGYGAGATGAPLPSTSPQLARAWLVVQAIRLMASTWMPCVQP